VEHGRLTVTRDCPGRLATGCSVYGENKPGMALGKHGNRFGSAEKRLNVL
jgi:hypothetical protein